MAKGTRYTPEFRAKAVRLLTESRSSYSSETKAIRTGRQGSGDSAGITAALAQPVGRDGRRGDEAVRAGGDGGELKRLRAENTELRRANEMLTTASAFFAARLDPTRC